MTRTRQLLAGLAALAALVALVAGIPWALWHYVGWPLPHAIPSWTQLKADLVSRGIPATVLIKALAVAVWVGWAVLTTSVLAEVAAAAGGRAGRHIPLAGPLQPLVGHLVAAVAIAVFATLPHPPDTSPVSLAASLGIGQPRAVVTAFLARDPAQAGPPSGPPGVASTPAAVGVGELRRYVVRRRDTLWGIAQTQLGDPTRWREIFALNAGRPQPGGVALRDPNRIWPGWTLLLPPAATVAAGGSEPAGDPRPQVSPRPVAAPMLASAASLPQPPASPSERAVPTVSGRHARPPGPPSRDEARAASAVGWIELASGSRVGAGFAAGVLAALTVARLRRRRSYRPQPPAPGVCPGAAPPPAPPALRDLLAATRYEDPDEPDRGADLASPVSANAGLAAAAALTAPVTQPELIEAGSRDGQVLPFPLTGWGGLALGGPGAQQTARAWLTDLLTRAGTYGAEILGPAALLHRMFPGVAALAALRPVLDDAATLRALEAEVLRRTRLLHDADVADATSYRRDHREDPLPVLIAITDTIDPAQLGSWRATLRAGARLAIDALILHSTTQAEAGIGAHLVVDTDGTVQTAHPERLDHALGGARLFAMNAGEASELLAPIAAIQHSPDEETSTPFALARPGSPVPACPTAETPAEPPPRERAPIEAPTAAVTPGGNWPRTPPAADDQVIEVQLLGPLRIRAWGSDVATGLRASARELLAWYLCHPDGATAEAAIDALWPDVAPNRGAERFWTALGNLRSRLRGPDQRHVDVLVKTGDVYRAQTEVLEVDLWRFQNALGDAAHTHDPQTAREALANAAGLYRGDLLAAADYLWIEPAREDLHRRALDAHARLAELHAGAGRVEVAIETLEHAIVLDPLAEEMYRRLITLLAQLGRPDAIKRTWIQLQARLADLDLDPGAETVQLLRRVTAVRGEPQVSRR